MKTNIIQQVDMPEIKKSDLANRENIREWAKDGGVKRHDETHLVKISRIVKRFNPREEFDGIEELAVSLKNSGQRIPGIVVPMKDGKFVLQDGERRLRAWHIVWEETGDEPSFLCRFADKEQTEAERIVEMFLTQDNRQFTPLEAARCIYMLNNMGWSPEEISAKTGKKLPFIKDAILLYRQNGEIKEAVKENHISMTTAIAIVRKSDTETQAVETVRKAVTAAKETGKKQSGSKVLTPVKKADKYAECAADLIDTFGIAEAQETIIATLKKYL